MEFSFVSNLWNCEDFFRDRLHTNWRLEKRSSNNANLFNGAIDHLCNPNNRFQQYKVIHFFQRWKIRLLPFGLGNLRLKKNNVPLKPIENFFKEFQHESNLVFHKFQKNFPLPISLQMRKKMFILNKLKYFK